ncbi:antitoxin [Caulobacter sp. LARHSG274]
MADGFDIHLDSERAARLKAAADLLGMSPEDYAALLIDQGLAERAPGWIDPDPAIDEAIADEVERTGDAISWPEFQARLRKFGGREG